MNPEDQNAAVYHDTDEPLHDEEDEKEECEPDNDECLTESDSEPFVVPGDPVISESAPLEIPKTMKRLKRLILEAFVQNPLDVNEFFPRDCFDRIFTADAFVPFCLPSRWTSTTFSTTVGARSSQY